jgi:DNA-binding NarL/FixJ family response regulator
VSISGQSNDSYASNETYRDLKHELGEIKALLNELERPSTIKPDDRETQASTNSLKRDILEVKEKIEGSVHQIVADSAPPQSTVEIVPDHFITSVLTPEETAIMVLVAKGMTNKQIAIEMECSESKIQKHMTAMFKKAEVNNRAELVVWWGEYLQDNNAADTNENSHKAATLVKRKSKDKPNPSLTGKDKVVLDFLVGGMTIDEIASKTNSSKGRVSKQLGKLFQIANVNSRTDLLNWWSKTGNAS